MTIHKGFTEQPPRFPIWEKRGKFYYADQAKLEELSSKVSEEELRRRMGAGRQLLSNALAGAGLNYFEREFIESAFTPRVEPVVNNLMESLPRNCLEKSGEK